MPIALIELEASALPSVTPVVHAAVAQHDLLSLREGSSVIKPEVLEQMKLAFRQGSVKRATSADSVEPSAELPAVAALNVRASALAAANGAPAVETPTYFLVPGTNPPIYVAANPKQHEQVVQDERLGVKRSRSESATTAELTDSDDEQSLAKQAKPEDVNAAQDIAKSLMDWCDIFKQVDRAHRRAVKRGAAKRRGQAKPQLQEVKLESNKLITLSPSFTPQISAQMLPLSMSLPSSPSTGSIGSLHNWLDGSTDSDSGSSTAASTPVPPSDDDEELPNFDLAASSSAATSEDEGAGLWHSAVPSISMLADPKQQRAYASANVGDIFVGAAAPHDTYF